MRLLDGTSRAPLPGPEAVAVTRPNWAPILAHAVTDVSALDYEDLQLYAEVHRIVGQAVALAGTVPAVGSPAWWGAPPMARLAALLVVAEHHLMADPERIAAEQLKAVSVAISTGMDWAGNAHRLIFDSRATIVARRREPGPLAGMTLDPQAAARWVETGVSEEPAA